MSRSRRPLLKIEPPYNPLDKNNLGISVSDALLERPVMTLPPQENFAGAGIYALYYVGDYAPYAPIVALNQNDQYKAPIYVGKAVPAGSRKGGFEDAPTGIALLKRLREHANSIRSTHLNVGTFAAAI